MSSNRRRPRLRRSSVPGGGNVIGRAEQSGRPVSSNECSDAIEPQTGSADLLQGRRFSGALQQTSMARGPPSASIAAMNRFTRCVLVELPLDTVSRKCDPAERVRSTPLACSTAANRGADGTRSPTLGSWSRPPPCP